MPPFQRIYLFLIPTAFFRYIPVLKVETVFPFGGFIAMFVFLSCSYSPVTPGRLSSSSLHFPSEKNLSRTSEPRTFAVNSQAQTFCVAFVDGI